MNKLSLCTSVLLCFGIVGSSVANEVVSFDQCTASVDQVAFVVDVSGSMMKPIGKVKETAQKEFDQMINAGQYQLRDRPVPPANEVVDQLKRVELAKQFIEKTSKYVLTDAQLQSSLYSLAPFKELASTQVRSFNEYQTLVDERLNTNLEVFGRPTWIGQRGLETFAKKVDGKSAVVLVTDGNFDTKTVGKVSPVDALKKFYESNPNSCVHIVSVAYTPEEKQAVETLANVNTCGEVIHLEEVMLNESLLQDFVSSVFFDGCTNKALADLKSTYFKFDSATLTEEGKRVLRNAVKAIQKTDASKKITIVGWTDTVGSDAYNVQLSKRRANSVKEFLVKNGVDEKRLSVSGKGKSTKYDNQTSEGRSKNRHVELLLTH